MTQTSESKNNIDLLPGTKLGRYEICSQLGTGGMGEVYLADDLQLGRKVAIKVRTSGLVVDDKANRLVKEARAAAALDHPNICSIYEVSDADGRSFIAMQYLEGITLDDRIKGKPLELNETLAIASQIADAAEAEVPIILGQHPVKDPYYHHATYDIARVYALEGKTVAAVKWLRETAVTGFQPYPTFARDAYLNRIRQAPEFIQFMAEMKTLNEKYRREFGR